jgi:hypothetical protein
MLRVFGGCMKKHGIARSKIAGRVAKESVAELALVPRRGAQQ